MHNDLSARCQKTARLDRKVIVARLGVIEAELPAIFGLGVEPSIACAQLHGRSDDHRSGLILHIPADCGCLCEHMDRRQQRKDDQKAEPNQDVQEPFWRKQSHVLPSAGTLAGPSPTRRYQDTREMLTIVNNNAEIMI